MPGADVLAHPGVIAHRTDPGVEEGWKHEGPNDSRAVFGALVMGE